MTTASQIRAQLDRVLASKAFNGAERAKSFLTFVVTTALEGRSEDIKESVIAVEALARTTNFDPKTDPIVRVEAGRLRTRLKTFYEAEGLTDPIAIELPKGSYVPEFSERSNGKADRPTATEHNSFMRVGTGVLAGILVSCAAWLFLDKPRPTAQTLRLSLLLPIGASSESLRISPDGYKVVFTALQGSRPALWVRSLDSADAKVIPGTGGASQPFWSPDSHSLGFFTTNRLLRVDLVGGPAQEICAASIPSGGGTWGRDGNIVFNPKPAGELYKVPATGGAPQPATKLDLSRGESIHRFPAFLPDGKHFLYVSNSTSREATAIRVGSTDSLHSAVLLEGGGNAIYAPQGNERAGSLLFDFHGTLMAQSFEPEKRQLSGGRTMLAPEIDSPKDGRAYFSASTNGMLLFRSANRKDRKLGWYDRNGRLLENVGELNAYSDLNLSPDEQRLVFTDEDPDWMTSVWVMSLRERKVSQMTNLSETSFHPFWSPNGDEVMFSNGDEHRMRLMRQSVNSAVPVTVLDTLGPMFLTGWSNDGRFVAYLTPWPTFSGLRTMILDLRNPPPRRLYETRYSETEVVFSPGKSGPRWIAYSSNETGQREIYVRNFPDLTRKWQVSNGGGWQPSWSQSGRELFYLSPDGILMAASTGLGTDLRPDTPHPLFRTNLPTYPMAPGLPGHSYAVSRDGERFLVNQSINDAPRNVFSVISHWRSNVP